MRIGTWNCRLNIDRKRAALDSLRLDVAVIPESSARPSLAEEAGVSHAWTGRRHEKGLGVFAVGDWSLVTADEGDPLPWCLPVHARHRSGSELLVLAVWTVKNAGDGRPGYADQFAAVIERWEQQLRCDAVVVAGDLNASLQGPSAGGHRRNLERLASLGTHSAYQLAHGPVGAADEPPTLRWTGRGGRHVHYHCDHVLVSAALTPRVRAAEVGTLADWVESGFSDHCPVVAELAVD